MLTSRCISLALGAASLAALLASTCAQAAPITVNLRVEGSTTTLYEGPISTKAILPPGITTESSSTAEPCDVADNGSNGGFGASAANPTSALYDAALSSHLTFNAEWFASLHDFEVTQVGTDVNGGEAEGFPSWGYAVNFTTAEVGGCQIRLAPGSEVLWAYNFFGLPHLLSLTSPTSADAGSPIMLHVVDGQTGAPIAGATIGEDVSGLTTPIPGTPLTNAEGNATVTLAHPGTVKLKATQPEAVRSNAVDVCVHNGSDGTCGTTTPIIACPATTSAACEKAAIPPHGAKPDEIPLIKGIANDRVFARHRGPRVLQGSVQVIGGGTLRQVRIRLERRFKGHCFNYSGPKEKLTRAKKCGTAQFFAVGGSESFSYLLPGRLPAGRYIYGIEAVNDSGQTTKLVNGASEVAFRVK